VVSVFLYLLYFPSYDVISDVIMRDADCTPGREPRSIAASYASISIAPNKLKIDELRCTPKVSRRMETQNRTVLD